ncbi:tetratricopeptide repeat protein [Streptomyces eurythermus]
MILSSVPCKSTVGDLESGRRSPTVRLAQVLDTALGGDGTLVELAEADLGQKNARGKTPATPAHDVVEVFPPGWDDDDVLRRNLLKLSAVGAATAALAGLTPDDNPLDGTSQDLLVAHQDLRAVHGRIDNLRGAQAVYGAARDHHDQIRGWLARTSSETERHRLNVLAADTGGFVGFLTYDLGQAELAITHCRDAAAHAQRAGDTSSCCNLLGQTSRVLADLGHHDKALALADRALHLAGTQAHPAVRCWLHAVRAHHHACLTDSTSAHSDLDAAWNLLGHTEDGEKPPYIGYLSEAELNKWTGHTAIRLAGGFVHFQRQRLSICFSSSWCSASRWVFTRNDGTAAWRVGVQVNVPKRLRLNVLCAPQGGVPLTSGEPGDK